MELQLDLFGTPDPPAPSQPIKVVEKPIEKPKEASRQEKKESVDFDIDQALKYIKEHDHSFWDMRVWKCRTYETVMKFLRDFEEKLKTDKNYLPTFTNSGHGVYLIGKLISNKVPLDTIASNLMLNKHVTYLYRITECFHHLNECPYWRHYGNYSDCNCDRRCDKKEIIGDEYLNP